METGERLNKVEGRHGERWGFEEDIYIEDIVSIKTFPSYVLAIPEPAYYFTGLCFLLQIGIQSAKFLLISTATLEYDEDTYIFFSAESKHTPPIRKVTLALVSTQSC